MKLLPYIPLLLLPCLVFGAVIAWDAPTNYVNGVAIGPKEIITYRVYAWTGARWAAPVECGTNKSQSVTGPGVYTVTATINASESAKSTPVVIEAPTPTPPTPKEIKP